VAAIDPGRALRQARQVAVARLDRATARLELVHPARRVEPARAALAAARRHLDALDPVRVLERGYAVVRAADGQVVRDAADVRAGDEIDVQVATGRFAATVGDR
jgi:exodeoxyribonuclease VII large subunit